MSVLLRIRPSRQWLKYASSDFMGLFDFVWFGTGDGTKGRTPDKQGKHLAPSLPLDPSLKFQSLGRCPAQVSRQPDFLTKQMECVPDWWLFPSTRGRPV